MVRANYSFLFTSNKSCYLYKIGLNFAAIVDQSFVISKISSSNNYSRSVISKSYQPEQQLLHRGSIIPNKRYRKCLEPLVTFFSITVLKEMPGGG